MKTNFVQLVVVTDYHDLDLICDAFKGLSLSNREIGVTSEYGVLKYVGVIFEGDTPSDGEIEDLLQESEIELETL